MYLDTCSGDSPGGTHEIGLDASRFQSCCFVSRNVVKRGSGKLKIDICIQERRIEDGLKRCR